MLHHASFNVRRPAFVAKIIAEMLAASVLRAPSPPFPDDSWFVLYGDSAGSFIELLPWGAILTPDTRFGVGRDEEMRPYAGSHVLLSTPCSQEKIEALATGEGWRTQLVDARLFKVLKVWIENMTLIELLTPAMTAAYVETFGSWTANCAGSRIRQGAEGT